MTKLEALGISSGLGALTLVKGLRRIGENEVFQFTKRAYTSKYPEVNIPINLSNTAMKRISQHFQGGGSITKDMPTIDPQLAGDSDVDKDADKFVGTSNYDEKTNVAGE